MVFLASPSVIEEVRVAAVDDGTVRRQGATSGHDECLLKIHPYHQRLAFQVIGFMPRYGLPCFTIGHRVGQVRVAAVDDDAVR
jgi:hypothetical protein